MDVAAWLKGLDLERYCIGVPRQWYRRRVLPKLTAEDLISIGVTPWW